LFKHLFFQIHSHWLGLDLVGGALGCAGIHHQTPGTEECGDGRGKGFIGASFWFHFILG
jgi:hypothetical protein